MVAALLVGATSAVALEPGRADGTTVHVGRPAGPATGPVPLDPVVEPVGETVPPTVPPVAVTTPPLPPLPTVPGVPAVTIPRLPVPSPAPARRSDRLAPDGTYIADGDGSDLIRIGANHDFPALRLSPDGRRLAFFRNDRVWVSNADGSDAAPVSGDGRACCHLDWTPDGREIAYQVPGPSHIYRILAVSPDGVHRRVLVDGGAAPVWSPTGGRLMFTASAPESWLSVREPDGTVHRVARGIRSTPAWSPDGRQILASGFDPQTSEQGTWVFEADGSGRRRIDAAGDLSREHLSWSPDGTYVTWGGVMRAAVGEPERTWVARPDGSGARDVGAGSVSPVWVPPGGRLVVHDRNGRAEVMNADGSGRRPFLETSLKYGVGRFSADGSRVVIGAW